MVNKSNKFIKKKRLVILELIVLTHNVNKNTYCLKTVNIRINMRPTTCDEQHFPTYIHDALISYDL